MNKGRIATIVGSVAVFMIAIELTIISVALPEMEAAFADASRSTLSWVFTAYNVGVASLLLICGWGAERVGRKRLFLAGLAVFLVGSVGSGIAPSVAVLIASRVVQAIGGAMLLPSSLALILAANDPGDHDVAIGVWGAMAGLAAAIGPSLGALLVDGAGWRWVFLINVPIAAIAILVGVRRLDESRDPNIAPSVDIVAVPAGAAAVGVLVFILVAAESVGWLSAPTIGLFLLAAFLLGVFVQRSRTHPSPVFDPAINRLPTFRTAAIGTLLFVAGFTGWLALAPTFLTEVWDYSVLQAGFAIAPGPVAMAVAAGPSGRLVGRIGHGKVIAIGAVLSAAAVLWWVLLVRESPSYAVALLPGLLLLGVGVGMGFPMLAAAAMLEVPEHQYAMGAAGNTTVRQVGMALGIAAAVAVIGLPDEASADAGPFQASWALCGVLFLLTAAVMVGLPRVDGASRGGRDGA